MKDKDGCNKKQLTFTRKFVFFAEVSQHIIGELINLWPKSANDNIDHIGLRPEKGLDVKNVMFLNICLLKVHKHEIFLNFCFDVNKILICPW
jgi:hypothetical protein